MLWKHLNTTKTFHISTKTADHIMLLMFFLCFCMVVIFCVFCGIKYYNLTKATLYVTYWMFGVYSVNGLLKLWCMYVARFTLNFIHHASDFVCLRQLFNVFVTCAGPALHQEASIYNFYFLPNNCTFSSLSVRLYQGTMGRVPVLLHHFCSSFVKFRGTQVTLEEKEDVEEEGKDEDVEEKEEELWPLQEWLISTVFPSIPRLPPYAKLLLQPGKPA